MVDRESGIAERATHGTPPERDQIKPNSINIALLRSEEQMLHGHVLAGVTKLTKA